MKIRDCLIPAVLTVVSCWAGFKACSDPVSEHVPADNSGRTSIVIDIEGIGWCELRGPARWKVLDDCTGPPIVPTKRVVQAKANYEGFIVNPHCISPAG